MNSTQTYYVESVVKSKVKNAAQITAATQGSERLEIEFLTNAKTAPRVHDRLTVNIAWKEDE